MSTVIKVENLSKQYRLGQVGTGSLAHDLNRGWHKLRGKEDPYLKIGEANDRSSKGTSEYVWALKDINFEVQRGEVLGIIGRNGAGKSTLLKILSRTTTPTTGSIKMKGRIASLLEVGTGFHPELSGRENIFLNGAIMGMSRQEIKNKFDEIVDFAGVERYIDTPVKRYSSGMYVRLAFGVAAHLEPDILIVDEVLAVGDAEFQKKALGKMKDVSGKDGRTVLFVSHNMDAVRKLCSSCIYLQHGLLEQQGTTEQIITSYLTLNKSSIENSFKYSGELPTITRVRLNEEALLEGNLVVEINYSSPHFTENLHPGFVLYNAFDTPIFGSNTRYHPASEKHGTRGIIHFQVNDIKLHSGFYKLSFWLGDEFSNYDYKEHAVAFDYVSNKNYTSKPDLSAIGYIDPVVTWQIET